MSFLFRFTALLFLIPFTCMEARDRIKIVGSSTLYPFATIVAEEYAAITHNKTPLVESTGSGGGFKIFCKKDSLNSPDITNASRRIKLQEFEACKKNGRAILELSIGYDGIALVEGIDNTALNITQEQLVLALLEYVPNGTALVKNPYTRWNEIDPTLPDREIVVYGPPSSSGTRDTFDQLILQNFCNNNRLYYKKSCQIRLDGAYIPSGENDNIIIKRLQRDRDAIGIFGFNFLMENEDKVSSILLDGIKVDSNTIASGTYPITRKLYIYVDINQLDSTQGLDRFIELFLSDYIISKDGLLTDSGLVTLLPKDILNMQQKLKDKTQLSYSDLFNKQ